MAERLPLSWLPEMSIYSVKFGGDTIITRVADRQDIVEHGISELRRELKSCPKPVVGIDVVNDVDLLLFYVKRRCLIVQLKRMVALDYGYGIPTSHCLLEFLRDTTVTFVGPGSINKKSLPYYENYTRKKFELKTVKDICLLAAEILNKAKLSNSTLEEVAVEAGVDIKKPITSNGAIRAHWASSSVLSEEEVKFAIYEVYSCYQIACKLYDVNRTGSRITLSPGDLYEMSTRYVSIGGATVTTRVIDRVTILNLDISELKSELKFYSNPVVGIDIINGGDLLLFYVNRKCLIIQFRRMMALDSQTSIPQSLQRFLEDENITFVGNINQKTTLSYISDIDCCERKTEYSYRITDVCYLAAKALKKPELHK